MKTIILMPVFNEAWILPCTLHVLSDMADVIIVADQGSTDRSQEILSSFKTVEIIKNHETVHSNRVRWQLLDAARHYDGKNFIFCIDADEYVPTHLFEEKWPAFVDGVKPGQGVALLWIQLWRSLARYCDDGSIWSPSWKPVAWRDDRHVDYSRDKYVVNDHCSRIPQDVIPATVRFDNLPLIHLQWAFWDLAQLKQVWYRCNELLENQSDPLRINQKYAITLGNRKYETSLAPHDWRTEELFHVAAVKEKYQDYMRRIKEYFERYGIGCFEPLQIWHIPELRKAFESKIGRAPRPVTQVSLAERLKTVCRRIVKA